MEILLSSRRESTSFRKDKKLSFESEVCLKLNRYRHRSQRARWTTVGRNNRHAMKVESGSTSTL